MTQRLITLGLLLGLTFSATAQKIFIATGGKVHFFSETPVENIDAVTNSMSSVLNTINNTVAFTVPMRTFKFEKSLMEEHFNEKYVESEIYPKATFNAKINESINWERDTVADVTATGEFFLHGVTRTITEKGKLTISEGSISLSAVFNVALKDYKIEVPKLVTKNIAETIRVDLNCKYVPYKKE
jgi:hypothetical protein